MRSSYIQNNYGDVFYSIVTGFCPRNLVELGVLDGYSTLNIAKAIKYNEGGLLTSFDLFEDYPYKHGNYDEVCAMIKDNGLSEFVKIVKEDAFKVHNYYLPSIVDFLHVDISNGGDTVKIIMEQWDKKMVRGGVIIFEGGSEERDQIDWMIKYNRPSIKKELETNEIIKNKYVFGTYLKFPSLTMLLKKGD